MLRPKKTKFKKVFKDRIRGFAMRGNKICFGEYGLQSLDAKRIKDKQIESARKMINGYLKRMGKLWIRVFPHVPVTKKPTETRMGKGKGDVEFFVFKVKPGKVLFELSGITEKQAINAFNLASSKLPIKTRFIKSIYKVI